MRFDRWLRGLLLSFVIIAITACGNSSSTASTSTSAPAVQPAVTSAAAPAATEAIAPATTATAAAELSTPATTETQVADMPTTAATEAATEAATAASATTEATSAAATADTATGSSTTGMRTFQIVSDQSEASYEVQEKFLSAPLPNKAIGKTNAVTGEFQFTSDGQPTGKVTKITVDLRTLTSDQARRDSRIHTQWLESDKYPYAEFTSTDAQNLPASYTDGQEVSFKLTGDMKIHDVTKPVTFDVKGKLEGDTVTGSATTLLMMKDFGFDPPSIAGMLTVDDGVTVVVNFTAKEAK